MYYATTIDYKNIRFSTKTMHEMDNTAFPLVN